MANSRDSRGQSLQLPDSPTLRPLTISSREPTPLALSSHSDLSTVAETSEACYPTSDDSLFGPCSPITPSDDGVLAFGTSTRTYFGGDEVQYDPETWHVEQAIPSDQGGILDFLSAPLRTSQLALRRFNTTWVNNNRASYVVTLTEQRNRLRQVYTERRGPLAAYEMQFGRIIDVPPGEESRAHAQMGVARAALAGAPRCEPRAGEEVPAAVTAEQLQGVHPQRAARMGILRSNIGGGVVTIGRPGQSSLLRRRRDNPVEEGE